MVNLGNYYTDNISQLCDDHSLLMWEWNRIFSMPCMRFLDICMWYWTNKVWPFRSTSTPLHQNWSSCLWIKINLIDKLYQHQLRIHQMLEIGQMSYPCHRNHGVTGCCNRGVTWYQLHFEGKIWYPTVLSHYTKWTIHVNFIWILPGTMSAYCWPVWPQLSTLSDM